MNDRIEQIEYKGYFINIYYEIDPINPREEFDNLGTMVCWHSRYNLGDKTNIDSSNSTEFLTDLAIDADESFSDVIEFYDNGNGWLAIENKIRKEDNQKRIEEHYTELETKKRNAIDKMVNRHYVILPLYLYDHSGITMSTSRFNSMWDRDSGQVGYIYISYVKIKKEYAVKRISRKLRKKVFEILQYEVQEYDDYLTGSVYGYSISTDIDDDNDIIDSCWGFFGNDFEKNGLLENARDNIDWHIEEVQKAREKKQ